jgi:hypothetical protein
VIFYKSLVTRGTCMSSATFYFAQKSLNKLLKLFLHGIFMQCIIDKMIMWSSALDIFPLKDPNKICFEIFEGF